MKLKRVIAEWHAKRPEVKAELEDKKKKRKKPDRFALLQYIEDRRIERLLITDGVYEMMNEQAFIDWSSFPRNGGLSHENAKSDFARRHAAPAAITDNGGPTEKLRRQVAVKVKTEIRVRDLDAKSRRLEGKNVETKKGTEEQMTGMLNQMQRGSRLISGM